MSKLKNISKRGTSLKEPQEMVCRPIAPRSSGEEVVLSSPSGAYRVSEEAIVRINRVEARAGRVFATAARFAFR